MEQYLAFHQIYLCTPQWRWVNLPELEMELRVYDQYTYAEEMRATKSLQMGWVSCYLTN